MSPYAAKTLYVLALASAFCLNAQIAVAENIRSALAKAYNHNPTLNAQRAATRGVDEGVPLAKSGWLPSIFFDASHTINHSRTKTGTSVGSVVTTGTINTKSYSITIQQTLWDSYRTLNNVSSANAAVRASRETLRNSEQNVLFEAATAFADVIQFRQIEGYRRESLKFLNEQVRSERIRFDVGESTRTDVSQAEASRDAAVSQLQAAIAQKESAIGAYRRFIGQNPGKLHAPGSIGVPLPKNLQQAIDIARREHPAILATQHLVDQASFNVKASESNALPTLTLQGSASRTYEAAENTDQESASLTAQLRIPIYQAGRVAAQVRQGKEILGQRRIEVDQSIDQVRASVVSSFTQLSSNKAAIIANQSQLRAAKLALSAIVEERTVGQRTTLDVLNTEQQVLNAQIAIAQTTRNVIVAEYALLLSLGRLSSRKLGLNVTHYDPVDHYIKVKDRWRGLRTPDNTQ